MSGVQGQGGLEPRAAAVQVPAPGVPARGGATRLRLVLGAAALLALAACERVEGAGAGRSSGPYVGGAGGLTR